MKFLTLIAVSALLSTPALACEEHKAASKSSKSSRKVASETGFSGAAAKLVFEGLPGAADRLGDGVLGKEGELICYLKDAVHHCSVRGEDEESGTVDGAHAKMLFEKLSSGGEYEDGANGIARESMVNCYARTAKGSLRHNCTLN